MLENKLVTIPVCCKHEKDSNKQKIDFRICPHSRKALVITIKNPSCDCYIKSACAFTQLDGTEAFCQKIPEDCRETMRESLMVLMRMVNEPTNKLPC